MGAVEVVLSALLTHADCVDVQRYGGMALSNLTRQAENIERLVAWTSPIPPTPVALETTSEIIIELAPSSASGSTSLTAAPTPEPDSDAGAEKAAMRTVPQPQPYTSDMEGVGCARTWCRFQYVHCW